MSRFDPIYTGNLNLANPQELNPYVYCYNNPVNLYDPDGNNAALAISTSNLIVDYYYNRHLLQQYYSFYDGCPSCGAGASAKFFPPDNPFGFKFGMACFSHDAAQATVGISWTRASTIFGMALLDMVTEQTNDIFDYDFTPAFELGIVYWIGGSIALPSYFYSQADAQYFIINGRIIRMKNSPKDKRKEEKNKQENQVDKDANSVEDNSINRFNSSNFGTGVNWNPGNYFNPKYHNAGSCEYW